MGKQNIKPNERCVEVKEIERGYGTKVIDSVLGSSPPYPIEAKYEEVDRHLVLYQEKIGTFPGQRIRKILKVLHKGEETKAKKFCKKTIESLIPKYWPEEI